MNPNYLIVAPHGLRLSRDEKQLFAALNPWGVILFARNIESPDQVKALLNDIHNALQRNELAVLIDQEGGRVSRLPASHWRVPPSPTIFAALYQKNPSAACRACYLNNVLIGADLKSVGINVNCAPMVDIPQADAAEIIHERAYGSNAEQVISLATEVIKGLKVAGVEPVIKHMPGHGRGKADSHFTLPRVDASLASLDSVDFAPFKAFNNCSMAMSAHIVFEAIDAYLPASISPTVVSEMMRQHIGFEGLIMTDDINMQALSGSISERAQGAIKAGADIVLHCSGNLDEMRTLLDIAKPLEGKSALRAEKALALACTEMPEIDKKSVYAELKKILNE